MNMNWKSLALLASLSVTAMGGNLNLATRGAAPDYSIVIAKDAPAPYQSAAKELKDFVSQMTGVTLPILNDSQVLPDAAILIGPNRHSQGLLGAGYDLAPLKDDGFRLKVQGKHLLILGGKRGAQYGVYELLERFGGCRWYASWHSKIPQIATFAVPDNLDETQMPAFLMREPFWFDMFNTMQALRNKCNGNRMNLKEENGGKICFGGGLFVHTLGRLLPVKEFFATHPEYFSEINGVRIKDRTQTCLSNPEVLKIVTERVLAAIRRDPTGTMYSVSQNDWYNPCQCAKCKAIKEQTGGTESGILIWFVNQVAEAVEKEFPNALIETLAYQYTREPPKKIRPRHNVVPRLCTIECDFAHPLRTSSYADNKKFLKDIEGWAAMSDKLFIWDYVTDFNHYIAPYPNVTSLQSNIQLFRDCHAVGIMSQGAYQAYHGDFAELKGWLGAKLLWNPDADVKALLDDFFPGYYGAGAPYVRQYFDELHALGEKTGFMGTFQDVKNNIYSAEFLAHATELWEKALAAVANDPGFLYNVRKGAMTVYYARLMLMSGSSPEYEWALDGTLKPTADAKLICDLGEKFLTCLKPVQGRVTRFCESQSNHDMRLAQFNRFQSNLSSCVFKANGWTAGTAPGLQALTGALCSPDDYNYLNGNAGGISSTCIPKPTTEQGLYTVKSATATSAVLEGKFGKNATQKAELSLAATGVFTGRYTVTGNAKLVNATPEVWSIACALNLGATGNACYRIGKGDWKEITALENGEAVVRLSAAELGNANSITLVSPKTRRAAVFKLQGGLAQIPSVTLHLYAATGTVKLQLLNNFQPLANASVTRVVTVTPTPIAGMVVLPEAKAFNAPAKVRQTINPLSMSIGHPGEWGNLVADMDAEDGLAIKMYGTHYEWCFHANTDFTKLSPNTKYRIRFHVKVEKKADKGEAFWAGLYDMTDKEFLGQCQPKVEDIKDNGYHWYTALDVVPKRENNLWIWAGPGRFKGNDACASKAVYIDKVELIPLD